jgi:3-phosphoshikimate 1-carboxyvinyltransferase
MKSVKISAFKTHIKTQIALPASKSISNRALILKAVTKQIHQVDISLENLSDADDTLILIAALSDPQGKINIKNSGTCARFLCAYFAAVVGSDIELYGDNRMHERPIGALVNALKVLGADITYLENDTCLPIKIRGKQLSGGTLNIDASASSQFASALMLISPLLSSGLNLNLSKEVVSKSYIEMTVAMMKDFGYALTYQRELNQIEFKFALQKPVISTYHIEADWSSAAFFYEAALLSEEAELVLKDLKLESIQGDAIAVKWFEKLGVSSELVQTGIKICKTNKLPTTLVEFDFTDYPDLAPAIICASAGAGIAMKATGLSSLVHKESNRVLALLQLLQKLHIKTESDGINYIFHDGLQRQFYHGEILSTEKDHRLAMAFGMLAQYFSLVRLSESNSVIKSFPYFWEESEKIGLERD